MLDKHLRMSKLTPYQFGLATSLISLTVLSFRAQANEAIPIRSSAIDLQPVAQILPQERLQSPSPIPSPIVLPLPQPTKPPVELQIPSSLPTSVQQEAPVLTSDAFPVETFDFEGNTVFSDEQLLNEVVKKVIPDLSKGITFSQLLQIRSSITQFYVDRGYITSGAYIPPQVLDGTTRIIKMRIVEGKLVNNIVVEGTNNSTQEYIENRLNLNIDKPLNQQDLLEALRILQVDPRISKVDAELQPAEPPRPGRNQLFLRITDAERSCTFGKTNPICALVQLAVDNARSPSVGSDRRQIRLNLDNTIDEWNLDLVYGNTRGSNSIDFAFSKLITANDYGSKESFEANRSVKYQSVIFRTGRTWNNIIERPFNKLDINTDSAYVDVNIRNSNAPPGSRSEFAWNFTGSWQQSKSSLLGIDLPLSRDADITGRTKVFTLRVAPEWTLRKPRSVLSMRGEVSFGFNAGPGETFAIFRGQGQLAKLLAPETLFLARVNTQLASGPLPVLEQIAFGGQDSLRGYRQNFLLADNGVYASVELQLPVLRFQLFNEPAVIQIVPFVDFSIAGNSSKAEDELKIPPLWSTGVGLQARLSDRFKARIDFGIPLVTTDFQGNSLPKQGTYFTVSGILAF